MKLIVIFFTIAAIFFGLSFCTMAQNTSDTFQMGNKQVIIPAPKGFSESLSPVTPIKELFTATEAAGNDLLAVHIPNEHLEIFKKGKVMDLSFYTKVSVSKKLRNLSATETDFANFVEGFKKFFPAAMNPDKDEMKKTLSKLSENLSNLTKEKSTFALDKPYNLGQIVDNPNAYGVLMLMEVKINIGDKESLRIMVAGMSVIRVRERLVYIYTYKQYEKEQDITDLKTFSSNWLSQIAAANK